MRKKNINQEMAINHGNGPCLVIAGPGSGKTYVLTNRVLSLIDSFGVDPESILVITFTRASANEMRQRFVNIAKDKLKSIDSMPKFGTFHSVFFEILKSDFGYDANSLLNNNEERALLSEVFEKYRKFKISQDFISNILKDIKYYKLSLERKDAFIPKSIDAKLFYKVYKDYQEKLFLNKKLDFSDMIFKCYELLKADKKILDYYRNRFKYILIDEFQDINRIQYDLVKLICKNKNIFVVGDDDQSIYKFRGSHPKVMIDFMKDYHNAKIINLNENYRCARQIVKFSKMVIDYNKDRFKKDLVANRDEVGKLEIKAFEDAYDENNYIISLIKKYKRLGNKLSNMAVLYRTNLLSNSIKSLFNKYNISYRVKGADNNFYDHFAIKDLISYLRLSIGDANDEDLLNISNKPLRYISRDSIKYCKNSIDNLIEYYHNKDYVLSSIYKLKKDLLSVGNNITPLAIRYIRINMGYDKYLKDYCLKNGLEYEDIEEILDEFEDESIYYKNSKDFLHYIDGMKKIKDIESDIGDSINLMTFHLSKGLEFDTVFIIDSNDGLIPHKKSIRENDLETERRLFYVAMTRAKNNLHICFTTRRFGKDFKPSRFILEAIGG